MDSLKKCGSEDLLRLIEQCLQCSPAQRPSAAEALHSLLNVSVAGNYHVMEMSRLDLVKTLTNTVAFLETQLDRAEVNSNLYITQ